MESIEEPAASYTDIFPPGQPFRSLYATHALVEYKGLAGQSRYSDRDSSGKKLPLVNSYTEARQRAVAFIVQAILDPKVTSHRTPGLELQVTSSLMQTLVQWLQGKQISLLLAPANLLLTNSRLRSGADTIRCRRIWH